MSSKKNFLIVMSCLLLGLLQGCSRKVEGDVFIRARDGSSTKLSVVQIFVMPLAALADFQKDANAKRDKSKADVLATIANMDIKGLAAEHEALAQEESAYLTHDVKRLLSGRAYEQDPVGDRMNDAIRTKHLALIKKMKEKFLAAKIPEVSDQFDALEPVIFYSKEILPYTTGQKVIPTVSDVDGKFSIDIGNEDLALVAIAKGANGNSINLWIVKLDSKDKKIALSDTNSFNSGCNACLLSSIDKSLEQATALSMGVWSLQDFLKRKDYELDKKYRESMFEYLKKASII